jgi:hypothetical protein
VVCLGGGGVLLVFLGDRIGEGGIREVPVKVATPRNRLYPHLQFPVVQVEAVVGFGSVCLWCVVC